MGKYVDKVTEAPFDWNNEGSITISSGSVDGSSAYGLVNSAFQAALNDANAMMEILVGTDGVSGSLGELLTSIDGIIIPTAVTAAIQWVEQAHDTSLYNVLINRLTTDLQYGATGLDADVEADIFSRAIARQNVEEDKAQTEIEDYFTSKGFDLPPLAMAARLQEHTNSRMMRVGDLNGQILKEQADLAQKNSQFVIQAATTLEGVLRDFTNKRNDRSLDFAKAVAANTIAIYAAQIEGYKAETEARTKIAEAMADIGMQQIASARGSIHASAGLTSQHGSSVSESVTHSENRSIGWDLNNTLSEQHPFEDEAA
jgi:hypothetical protein